MKTGVSEAVAVKRVLGIFLLFLFHFPGTGFGESSPYKEALQMLAKGDFVGGVKQYYKFLLKSDPLLSVECRKKDLSKAEGFFSERIRKSPKDPKAHLSLSLIERMKKDWTGAIQRLNLIQEMVSHSMLLIFLRGEFFLGQGKEKEALRDFEQLKKDPKGKKFVDLAELLKKRYGLVIRKDSPPRKDLLLRQAFRFIDEFEREQAEKLLRAIMDEFPQDSAAPAILADLLIESDRSGEADSLLAEWEKKLRKPLLLPLPEARLRFRQERHADVVRLLDPVLTKDPGNSYVKVLLSESLFQTRSFERSLIMFRELRTEEPGNPVFPHRIASCLEGTGKFQEALQFYIDFLAMKPGDPWAQMQLAVLYERMEEWEKARDEFGKLAQKGNPFEEVAAEKAAELSETIEKLKKEKEAQMARDGQVKPVVGGEATSTAAAGTAHSTDSRPNRDGGGGNESKPKKNKKEEFSYLKNLYE